MRYILSICCLMMSVFSFADSHSENCELYPLTLPIELFSNHPSSPVFEHIPLGTGPGNYSWLTWDEANDAPSLALSLIPPGNSETYINPNDPNDHLVSIGDWVEGRPGVKNSRDIRDNLTALLGRNIRIPAWDITEGQGSQFDYQVADFIEIELTDFKLNGKGWISFVFKGPSECESQSNTPPVAENLQLETIESTGLNITVVATDADNDPLIYIIVTQPQNGTLSGDGPNYVYTPNPGFIGDDSFSFKANDGTDDSNVATATINVLPDDSNSPPVAQDLEISGLEGTQIDLTVIATDADNDPLTYRIVTPPQNGELIGDGPNYSYIPNSGFTGIDSFSFVASDGIDDSNEAIAVIEVLPDEFNTAPFAGDYYDETFGQEPITFTLYAVDEEEDPLTFIIVTPPSNGTLTGSGPTYTYTPNAGFEGSDFFYFKVNDGKADSNIAEVEIAVFPEDE